LATHWNLNKTRNNQTQKRFHHRNLFQKKGDGMPKVKTFASSLKIFHAKKEIEELDAMVNKFIEDNKVQKIMSVSDAPTSDDNGATIGLIRVLAYE
jgi:hypothetical protein